MKTLSLSENESLVKEMKELFESMENCFDDDFHLYWFSDINNIISDLKRIQEKTQKGKEKNDSHQNTSKSPKTLNGYNTGDTLRGMNKEKNNG